MHRWLAFGAPTYELFREQWVPGAIDNVFAFFEDPHNLARITPPWLGFHIVSMEPNVIQVGTVIDYRLYWLGIPYRWRTLIADWVQGERFVDTQIRGPYILWHHTHTFTERAGGVLLMDRVRYRLPFGPLGALTHWLVVRRQLAAVFDYRALRIGEILAQGAVHSDAPARPAEALPS